MDMDILDAYLLRGDPGTRDLAFCWQTAAGLQAAAGMRTSDFLAGTALRTVRGELPLEAAQQAVHQHWRNQPGEAASPGQEAADTAAVRTAVLLADRSFSLTPVHYISIHRTLFSGILSRAGELRTETLSRPEPVLNGASVLFCYPPDIQASLEYELEQERRSGFSGLSGEQMTARLARFAARLWQIQAFEEGSTRTTAVFLIRYARKLGFRLERSVSPEDAAFFRGALVRANYTDVSRNIQETPEYLEAFLQNLLLNGRHPLREQDLRIPSAGTAAAPAAERGTAEAEKPAAAAPRPAPRRPGRAAGGEDPAAGLPDGLRAVLREKKFSSRAVRNIRQLYDRFGSGTMFGRSDAAAVLNRGPSTVSELLRQMLEAGILAVVSGRRKYVFTICRPDGTA